MVKIQVTKPKIVNAKPAIPVIVESAASSGVRAKLSKFQIQKNSPVSVEVEHVTNENGNEMKLFFCNMVWFFF